MNAQPIDKNDTVMYLNRCFAGFDSIQAIAKSIQAGTADHVALAIAVDLIAGELASQVTCWRENILDSMYSP